MEGILDWLAGAGGYFADKLLVPTLTGIAVGLALRAAAIPREVGEHSARAEELNADLARWVRDRDRQLTAEINRATNLAQQGIIEDAEPPPVPQVGKRPWLRPCRCGRPWKATALRVRGNNGSNLSRTIARRSMRRETS